MARRVVLHYNHGGRPECREHLDVRSFEEEARMIEHSTEVKADATCANCIWQFHNSATPEQIALLPEARRRRVMPDYELRSR